MFRLPWLALAMVALAAPAAVGCNHDSGTGCRYASSISGVICCAN